MPHLAVSFVALLAFDSPQDREVLPREEVAPPTAPARVEPGASRLALSVMDEVDEVPIEGALVLVDGDGLPERLELVTDEDGKVDVDLDPGTYSVRIVSGRDDVEQVVTLEAGDTPLTIELDPGHWNRNMYSFQGLDARPELHRPRLATAGGTVLISAGLLMAVASGLEASKRACAFGLDDCSNAPRPGVAAGLGIAAGTSIVGGSLLVAAGVRGLRRAKAGVYASHEGGGASMTFAF